MVTSRDGKLFGSRQKKFQNLLRRMALFIFRSMFRHFGTHFAESFRMSKSSWMLDPTRSREMPNCSANYLAEIWRSSKINQRIWPIISWGGHCFGSSRTRRNTGGKITSWNWPTQFLTVAYDGAFSPNVSARMAWISFGALPCTKKLDDSWRLDVVEIAHVAWHAYFQPL